MQTNTLGLVTVSPSPSGSPASRSTPSGAEGFSRILDETPPDVGHQGSSERASGADDPTSPKPDGPSVANPPLVDQTLPTDAFVALATPLPTLTPQALVVPGASQQAEFPTEMPLPAKPADTPVSGAKRLAGSDMPAVPPAPDAPGTKPSSGASLVGEGASQTQLQVRGDPGPTPPVPPRSDAPAVSSLSGQGLPDPGQIAANATIRLGNAATESRRTSAQGAAALSFALRSAPDVADEVPAEPSLDPPLQSDAAVATTASSAHFLAPASDILHGQNDDTSTPTGLPMADRSALVLPPAMTATTHTVPASLGQELSTLLQTHPDGPVEISLSPDELGKLRVSLWQDGSGLRVVVQAERAETLDLLRRNSDQLMQEIRDSGFSGGSLSFGQWGAPPDRSGTPSSHSDQDEAPVSFLSPVPPSTRTGPASSSSLDLRY